MRTMVNENVMHALDGFGSIKAPAEPLPIADQKRKKDAAEENKDVGEKKDDGEKPAKKAKKTEKAKKKAGKAKEEDDAENEEEEKEDDDSEKTPKKPKAKKTPQAKALAFRSKLLKDLDKFEMLAKELEKTVPDMVPAAVSILKLVRELQQDHTSGRPIFWLFFVLGVFWVLGVWVPWVLARRGRRSRRRPSQKASTLPP